MATLKALSGTQLIPIFLIVMLVGLSVCLVLGYMVKLFVELYYFISALIGVGYG